MDRSRGLVVVVLVVVVAVVVVVVVVVVVNECMDIAEGKSGIDQLFDKTVRNVCWCIPEASCTIT